jgi:hypothetical protein
MLHPSGLDVEAAHRRGWTSPELNLAGTTQATKYLRKAYRTSGLGIDVSGLFLWYPRSGMRSGDYYCKIVPKYRNVTLGSRDSPPCGVAKDGYRGG